DLADRPRATLASQNIVLVIGYAGQPTPVGGRVRARARATVGSRFALVTGTRRSTLWKLVQHDVVDQEAAVTAAHRHVERGNVPRDHVLDAGDGPAVGQHDGIAVAGIARGRIGDIPLTDPNGDRLGGRSARNGAHPGFRDVNLAAA